jgi:hypothetical protein
MAKATRHGGVSYTEQELTGEIPVRIRRAELGRVDQLAGTDYSVRSKSETTKNVPEKASPLPPAPTTENPSDQPETVPDSSAHSTVGVTQKTEQPPSGKRKTPSTKATPVAKQNPKAARVRSTDEFDDEFSDFD